MHMRDGARDQLSWLDRLSHRVRLVGFCRDVQARERDVVHSFQGRV